jgi:hypothetical protein
VPDLVRSKVRAENGVKKDTSIITKPLAKTKKHPVEGDF